MNRVIEWMGYLAIVVVLFAPVFFIGFFIAWETMKILIQSRKTTGKKERHIRLLKRPTDKTGEGGTKAA